MQAERSERIEHTTAAPPPSSMSKPRLTPLPSPQNSASDKALSSSQKRAKQGQRLVVDLVEQDTADPYINHSNDRPDRDLNDKLLTSGP